MGYRNIILIMTMIWLFRAIENKEETKNIVFFISTCLGSFYIFIFVEIAQWRDFQLDRTLKQSQSQSS
jgi:hypothetical protein